MDLLFLWQKVLQELFVSRGTFVSLFIKGTFVSRGWLIIIFVICVNADIFTESTEEIVGSWGTTKNCVKVVKALTSAVKEAERTNDIAYPETFKLFKFLFPNILK